MKAMIFDKLVKPKWQHRNPDVRKQAVESSDDIALLTEIAQQDESSIVRRTAIRKLDDLNLLEKLAKEDADSSIRELSSQRFRQLLCGQKTSSLNLDTRKTWIEQSNEAELLEYVAEHAQEFELRLIALNKIDRDSLLGDIAINDSVAEIRLAAIEKITQQSTLERVYKTARNKDKRVSRIAKEKLDTVLAALARPGIVKEECEAICQRLEKLNQKQGKDLNIASKEFQQLQTRWQTIEKEVDTDGKTQFETLKQTFEKILAAYQAEQAKILEREAVQKPIRSAKQQVCEQLDVLQTDMQALRTSHEVNDVAAIKTRLQTLHQQWHDIATLDSSTEEQHWQHRFERGYNAVENQQVELQTQEEMAKQLDAICQEVEALLENDGALNKNKLKSIRERWTAITQPQASIAVIADLNQRYEEAITKLDVNLKAVSQKRDKVAQELKQTLTDLEAKLELGELHNALPLEQEAREALKHVEGISTKRYQELEKRLHACVVKIKELRSWERWGDNLERQRLCEDMEKLAAESENTSEDAEGNDLEDIARRIREAQKAWKKLGSTDYSHALWERFNKACNIAYKPCKVYFQEQATLRKENQAKKEVLCQEVAEFADQIDWEDPNWKEIHHFARDAEKQWYSIGTTDRKTRKTLKEAFDAAMKTINENLEAERKENLESRQELINAVKAAQAISDINKAIEEVKHLQSQWYVSVPGKRKDERELWKKFREECDKVFDRRKQEQEERQKERNNNLKARRAVCDKIEALAALTDEDAKSIPAQLSALKEEWHTIGLVAKKFADDSQKTFHTACKKANAAYQQTLVDEQRSQLDVLKAKAMLCLELETDKKDVESAKQAWNALSALEDIEADIAITKRFEQAVLGQPNFSPIYTEEKEELCIRLEILAGIDSPPEAHKARMAYQVARLNEAMQGGHVKESADKMTEAQDIEMKWYVVGAVEGNYAWQLENRFKRAVDAFYSKRAN